MNELHIIFDATLLVIRNFWPALVVGTAALRFAR